VIAANSRASVDLPPPALPNIATRFMRPSFALNGRVAFGASIPPGNNIVLAHVNSQPRGKQMGKCAQRSQREAPTVSGEVKVHTGVMHD
jgi:hypothetical protein